MIYTGELIGVVCDKQGVIQKAVVKVTEAENKYLTMLRKISVALQDWTSSLIVLIVFFSLLIVEGSLTKEDFGWSPLGVSFIFIIFLRFLPLVHRWGEEINNMRWHILGYAGGLIVGLLLFVVAASSFQFTVAGIAHTYLLFAIPRVLCNIVCSLIESNINKENLKNVTIVGRCCIMDNSKTPDMIDPTGTRLTPSLHGKDCLGNGTHPGIECCCEECDYFLTCFPEDE